MKERKCPYVVVLFTIIAHSKTELLNRYICDHFELAKFPLGLGNKGPECHRARASAVHG